MNPYEKIPPAEIQFFKEQVQRWVIIDSQISDLEKKIKELKKVRSKELEPKITTFMTHNNITDLSIDSVNMGNSMQFTCDHTFSPSIYISNKGDSNIDTIDFSVTINGSNVLTYNWVSSLNPGSSTMINLPSFYISESGNIEIRFAAEIRNNPLEYDIHNNGLMNRFNIRSQQEQPFVEHFENGFIDSLWFISNDDLAETWDTISTGGLLWNNFSASMQLFSYAPRDNQKDGLISPSILLSPSSASHTLKFDLAYQQRSISSQLKDTVKVYLSDNCGSSFDYLLYHKYHDI